MRRWRKRWRDGWSEVEAKGKRNSINSVSATELVPKD